MKIRTSFVTNSSSSSFIVSFDKKPESAEEMKQILFGDRKEYPSPYTDDYWSTDLVAEIVFKDMKNPATKEEIIEELSSLFYEYTNSYECPERPKDESKMEEYYKKLNKIWAEKDKKAKLAAIKRYDSEFAGKEVYIFGYSDNDGDLYSAMEHGSLFKKVKHTRISHH